LKKTLNELVSQVCVVYERSEGMIAITLSFISGFMVGFEIIWGEAIVCDIGIVRLMIHYGDGPPDGMA
jgi:hypothetical protein